MTLYIQMDLCELLDVGCGSSKFSYQYIFLGIFSCVFVF